MASLKGQLLIASPSLVDPFFEKSVILMFEHGEEGASGVVINRSSDAVVTDLGELIFSEPFAWEKSVSMGGPVPGPLMVVHQDDSVTDREVAPGLYYAIEDVKVRKLIQARTEPSVIIMNYSGWGPGQLESEFGRDSWLVAPADNALIFDTSTAEIWNQSVKKLNAQKLSKFLHLPEIRIDPHLN